MKKKIESIFQNEFYKSFKTKTKLFQEFFDN